jgi:transposase-like protein
MLSSRITLAEESAEPPTANSKRNHRNGSSKKTVLTGEEALELAIPRDRTGTFQPKLVAKHQRRLPGFDDKVISMYARGMTVREIQGHLAELYGIEVLPDPPAAVALAPKQESRHRVGERLVVRARSLLSGLHHEYAFLAAVL